MSQRLPNHERIEIEERACAGDSLVHHDLGKLVGLLRSAYHELDDPNYLYVGRIHRQAIISRNAEIDRLRGDIKALKDQEGKS